MSLHQRIIERQDQQELFPAQLSWSTLVGVMWDNGWQEHRGLRSGGIRNEEGDFDKTTVWEHDDYFNYDVEITYTQDRLTNRRTMSRARGRDIHWRAKTVWEIEDINTSEGFRKLEHYLSHPEEWALKDDA